MKFFDLFCGLGCIVWFVNLLFVLGLVVVLWISYV